MKIKDVLEQEISKSSEFTANNFGTMYGKEFPLMVNDIVESKSICALLLLDVCISGMGCKKLADDLASLGEEDNKKAILKNLQTFSGALSMLYWGIEIGKKIAKQENEVKALENLWGGTTTCN